MKEPKPKTKSRIDEILTDKSMWCQGHIAVDENGIKCTDPEDPNARQWCLLGALVLICDAERINRSVLNKAIDRVAGEIWIGSWNDVPDRKFEDVIELGRKIEAEMFELAETYK